MNPVAARRNTAVGLFHRPPTVRSRNSGFRATVRRRQGCRRTQGGLGWRTARARWFLGFALDAHGRGRVRGRHDPPRRSSSGGGRETKRLRSWGSPQSSNRSTS